MWKPQLKTCYVQLELAFWTNTIGSILVGDHRPTRMEFARLFKSQVLKKKNQKCDSKSLIGNLVSLTCDFQKRMLLVDGSWKLLCCAPSTAGNAADSFF